jgi:hypothetical protein
VIETLISQAVKHTRTVEAWKSLVSTATKLRQLAHFIFLVDLHCNMICQSSNFPFLSSFDSKHSFILDLRFNSFSVLVFKLQPGLLSHSTINRSNIALFSPMLLHLFQMSICDFDILQPRPGSFRQGHSMSCILPSQIDRE